MEADLLHGSLEQRSPYKSYNIRDPMKMKIHEPFISGQYEIFLPTHIPTRELLKAPPLSLQQPPQPPLLPLPVTHLRRTYSSLSPSCFPANRSGNGTKHHAFSPNKSTKKIPKKEEEKTTKRSSEAHVSVSSTSNFGRGNQKQPKKTTEISHFDSTSNMLSNGNSDEEQEDMLPGLAVFKISPPPSSLPLPTFSLRPKLSRNPVAASVDTVTTDNLRRLLQLQ